MFFQKMTVLKAKRYSNVEQQSTITSVALTTAKGHNPRVSISVATKQPTCRCDKFQHLPMRRRIMRILDDNFTVV
jgi:hypothetical protein